MVNISPFLMHCFHRNTQLTEGAVYHINPNEGLDEDELDNNGAFDENATLITPSRARKKFEDFLRNFRGHPNETSIDGQLIYRDVLSEGRVPGTIDVTLDDIIAHDAALAKALRDQPNVYFPILEDAVKKVAQSLRGGAGRGGGGGGDEEDEEDEEDREDDEDDDEDDVRSAIESIHVTISSHETPRSVRGLNSKDVSRLVCIPGIVIAASRAKAKASIVGIQCQSCKHVRYLQIPPGYASAQMPRTCEAGQMNNQQRGNENDDENNNNNNDNNNNNRRGCGLDPYQMLPDKCKFIDQQSLKLQENPEEVPAGEMPRTMMLCVDRKLVQKIAPGTRVSVVGVYTIGSGKTENKKRDAAGGGVQLPYIRVLGLIEVNEGARGNAKFTEAEHQEFKAFSQRPFKEVILDIRSRIAPAIFGSEDVKMAVACLMFSGSRKHLPDGARLRGDVNVLLLGDPSTAKSQFLKFVERTAPVCVYTSGKGSSAAGLTASVIRDSNGEFYLEGGAMVLADGGCVCIDEFDKMRDEDRVAIHEAMEQQTISIAKAGITTMLNSRSAVLAAANPPSGRYDDLKTAQENIDLQTTILSRFDLIFIVRDERLYERDMAIAGHVLKIHSNGANAMNRNGGNNRGGGNNDEPHSEGNKEDPAAERERKFMKRYIEYCRANCKPRINERSMKMLQDAYVKYREEMRERNKSGKGTPAVPITVRQLEAITRVSEALAKMCLQKVVTEEHVAEALRLFEVSTIDAARSGVAGTVVLSPEQREELQLVETQIRQKLAIGATTSKRHLVEDLSRVGVNEWAVMRALMVMTQRGEIVERAEGRRVTRKH